MNSKGSSVIFTSIMILLLSIVAMVVIIGFVAPYVSSLKEQIHYRQNKENIFLLNKEFVELRNYDINSYKNINIDAIDEIIFDKDLDTITIKQKISSNSFSNFKDSNYGNVAIVKENGFLVFTSYLSGIIDLNESLIVNSKATLEVKLQSIIDGISSLSIIQIRGAVSVSILPRFAMFLNEQAITITANPDTANVYYTTDGTEPTTESTLYTEPITITNSTMIKARGYANGYFPSAVAIGNYSKVLYNFNSFTVMPEDQSFEEGLEVIATVDPYGKIYYTTNGKEPTEESNLYESPIIVTKTTTLKFKAFKTNYNPTEIIVRTYTKNP